MNNAVLFSIKPKHCENIIIGIKKVEVRKKYRRFLFRSRHTSMKPKDGK